MSGENEKSQVSPPINFQNSLLCHDLKIIGQVGEVGQKEKLSYISLIHQIEADLAKGYSENEVVHAVINAISPGLSIRSYLEGSGRLPLSRLCKIIHSHYKEGSATEIYQQLLVMTQDPKEDALNFLIRLMDTRQKILFACKEEDENELKYSPSLVVCIL